MQAQMWVWFLFFFFLLLVLLKIVDCVLRFMQKINFNYTHANYQNLPLIMPKGEKEALPNFCLTVHICSTVSSQWLNRTLVTAAFIKASFWTASHLVSSSSQAILMPFPPPPAEALIMTGQPNSGEQLDRSSNFDQLVIQT